ncbi:unnamed protein product, partial [marine sediment metagenome]
FKILSKKYDDIELVIGCKVPNWIKKKYRKLKGLIFLENPPIPRGDFFSLYAKSDILLQPSLTYEYMTFLESMAFGLPIVTMDGFGNSEFVKHGKNGFLVDPPEDIPKVIVNPSKFPPVAPTETSQYEIFRKYRKNKGEVNSRVVEDMVKYCYILIENEALRRKMGRGGRKRIEGGDLSIQVRNRKLKKIYEEAIKR